jgi:hypothetical protein
MAEDAQAAKGGTNEKTRRNDDDKASPEKLSITMNKRIDLAVAVTVILVGAFILIEARDIRAGLIPDPITSRGLANITGTFLIIAGMIVALLRLKSWSALPGNYVPLEGSADEPGHPASAVRSFAVMLSALLWVFLLKPLGFLIVTPLFLAAILLIMGIRSKRTVIAFSIIFALILWITFSQILKIILPLGPLTALARSLGLTP